MISTDTNNDKKIFESIQLYLNDCCFDIQTNLSNPFSVAETHLIKVLTKIVVGSATVWWSLMELKNFIKNHKTF